MNKKQLDKFRKLLLEEKHSVLQHLYELQGSSSQQLGTEPGDQVDIAATEISQTAIQKLGNREKKHLQKVDYAIGKIDAGEYGICEMCGEEIGVARLEARPIALFCIDCKTAQEQKERQYVDSEESEEDGWTSSGEGGSSGESFED